MREEPALEGMLNGIHRGDCVAGMNDLPTACIDLAFADPPFNIGYEYDVYDDTRDREQYLDWSRAWISAVHRVLKPTGTFWLAIGDEHAAELKLLSRDLGFHCRSWVVWYYTFGVNCTRKFSRSHAHLFHFVKDPNDFTFNDEAIRVPSARQLVYADRRANPRGRLPDDTWILRPQDLPDGFKPDEGTWYFPRVAGTFKERAGFHGCQMPEQLLGRIIRLCSDPGQVVLDPFVGSGTTPAVAKKLGRRWIGFELSERYAIEATARVQLARVGEALDGAPEPLISAPNTPPEALDAVLPQPRHIVRRQARDKLSKVGPSGPRANITDQERGIVAAFLATSQGFSSDRLIADPELNQEYLSRCRRMGIPGTPSDWNRTLMRLRKAGRLADVALTRRTRIPWAEQDRYTLGSEIAMRKLCDERSLSLDEVICDPGTAAEFDEIARMFAPGFSPFEYRWAALSLRKRARKQREFSLSISPELARRRIDAPYLLARLPIGEFESVPAVYVVCATDERVVYVGETFDMGRRASGMRQAEQHWEQLGRGLKIGLLPLERVSDRLGLQSHWIREFVPELNLLELGFVPAACDRVGAP